MLKSIVTAGLVLAGLALAPSVGAQPGILPEIQRAVVQTIGAEPGTVEVTATANAVIVTRPNSNMNSTTHGARNNEAGAIAGVVARFIVNNPAFKAIVVIRVEYLARSGTSTRRVDTVEFRKDMNGEFRLHVT